ncbi:MULTISPECIES: hypothetical protein [unclassified Achromobacter]|uniref:hypothetical protein n=1 Tax=unclassified Achromobacter TaxID=2626865 RepID=UPI000B517E06|nr:MULTISPECIES: hypothetical protein [unclassified Achromobacter]OWT71421.1 hypothetical protein CEY05_24850 [Achromobacter sp. HZ34]OWT73078.1 hypothetical protein CEY04_23685 [Achromobacter sp. HZ28]
MHRRRFLRTGTLTAGLMTVSALTYFKAKGAQMSDIRFDLGKNIVETAKQSGVPAFTSNDVNGFIWYSINDIPPQVEALYTRPGYEIRWRDLFAFTLRADRARSEDLLVQNVTLQHRADFKNHADAQAFVMQTIAQFKQGRWQRAFPGDVARLTGRSSLLDEQGKINGNAASPDPAYTMSLEDWTELMRLGAQWRWSGDGILAKLDASTVGKNPDGSPSYQLAIDFYIEKIWDDVLEKDQQYKMKSLAENGVDTAKLMKENKEQQAARRKILEENAIKRGDKVLGG